MREHPGRTKPKAWRPDVVLPAEGATVARSLSHGLVLVAHTGNAHLGVAVDRALLRDLARARAAARATSAAATTSRAPATARPNLPEVVLFRHATAHTVGVSGGEIHLTLRATGDRRKPDVQVELRMHPPLVERLAQHQSHRRRALIAFALAALLLVTGTFVAILALVV